MKLKVEKLPTGKLRVEVAGEPGKKPLVVELDRAQVAVLVGVLQTAVNADAFTFVLEV